MMPLGRSASSVPGTMWATVSPQGPAKRAPRPTVPPSSPHEPTPRADRLASPGRLWHTPSTAGPAGTGREREFKAAQCTRALHIYPIWLQADLTLQGPPGPPGAVMASREDITQRTSVSSRFCSKSLGRKQGDKGLTGAGGSRGLVRSPGSSVRPASCPTGHSPLCPTNT